MRATVKIVVTLLAIAGFGFAMPAATQAADDCGGCGGESGHSSGGSGKGPKYQGGERGSEHSSQVHKGGTHHHDASTSGNKSIEHKIFASGAGARGKGGSGHDTGAEPHDSGTAHSDSEGGHSESEESSHETSHR